MKTNAKMCFGKLTVLTLFVICYTSCNNTNNDTAPQSNIDTVALLNANLEWPAMNAIPDLYFGVDSRGAAIKKADIDKATSIYDFLNEGEKQQIVQLNYTEIIIIKNGQQTDIRAHSNNDQLTPAQINLLRTSDLFTQFSIKTHFKSKNKENGKLEDRFFNPHLTIVPEKQATYVNGKEALIRYFKDHSKTHLNVIKGDTFNPVMIYFTVTKAGLISNVYLEQMKTGYPSIDAKFTDLVKTIPGQWSPAENAKGELIDQELVFTFGPLDGC
ncbi:hypothetical protein [Psychroserpens damuponensis]|uniref:hypothetical protein n=1 Tax=Psychroserpens damuponensis TaxID=943936 RepID=UPI00058DB522|nr:hypothetical protein [Psychroserpens damuponensis]